MRIVALVNLALLALTIAPLVIPPHRASGMAWFGVLVGWVVANIALVVMVLA